MRTTCLGTTCAIWRGFASKFKTNFFLLMCQGHNSVAERLPSTYHLCFNPPHSIKSKKRGRGQGGGEGRSAFSSCCWWSFSPWLGHPSKSGAGLLLDSTADSSITFLNPYRFHNIVSLAQKNGGTETLKNLHKESVIHEQIAPDHKWFGDIAKGMW